MAEDTILRVGGAVLILTNAFHKIGYPEIAVGYTWEVLVNLLPFDPVIYVFAVQAVSIIAAVFLLLNQYKRPAAGILALIVTFVALNLTAEGFFDLALREIAWALIFYAIVFGE